MSSTQTVLCPYANTTGEGYFSFNIPKGAVNVGYRVVDADTGGIYFTRQFGGGGGAAPEICSGTSTTVSDSFAPGGPPGSDDTYRVDYVIANTGGGNPAETKMIKAVAFWKMPADLELTKQIADSDGHPVAGDDFLTDQEISFRVTVTNHGPFPAQGVQLADSPSHGTLGGLLCPAVRIRQLSGPGAAEVFLGEHSFAGAAYAKWPEFPVDETAVFLVTLKCPKQDAYSNYASLIHNVNGTPGKTETVEPASDTHPNSDQVSFSVFNAPDSKVTSASASKLAGSATPPPSAPRVVASAAPSRTSTALDSVEIAVLRLKPGVEGLNGQLPAHATIGGGDCLWLKSKRPRFAAREPIHGICDTPLWLDADGAGRWHFKLARELPPGHYVAYSRAIDSGGGAESNFSKADANRVTFKVR